MARTVDTACDGLTWVLGWTGGYVLVGILMAQTSNRTLLTDFENAVMQALVD